jgi:hypothetical protein
LFPEIFAKRAVLQLDQRNGGSAGGTTLLKVAARPYGLIQALAGCLRDHLHKMLLDRDPVTGRDLASQPTPSRFENSIRPRELYRLGEALADSVIDCHAQRLHGRARLVTIDLDPTDDPTHGSYRSSTGTITAGVICR